MRAALPVIQTYTRGGRGGVLCCGFIIPQNCSTTWGMETYTHILHIFIYNPTKLFDHLTYTYTHILIYSYVIPQNYSTITLWKHTQKKQKEEEIFTLGLASRLWTEWESLTKTFQKVWSLVQCMPGCIFSESFCSPVQTNQGGGKKQPRPMQLCLWC